MWRDDALLLDMLIAARRAREFNNGESWETFTGNQMLQSATQYQLQIIGEAATKVSDDCRAKHNDIPWKQIVGFRHRLVHEYPLIEMEKVWRVVSEHLAPLISILEQIVPPDRSARYAADVNAVRDAARRISPYAHRTPIMTCATLDALARRSLFFKCENLQKIGAFKFRGACNAVMKLSDEAARRGVVTHSSGNHAQALALAARLRGIAAHIVMPKNSSAVKIRAVEGYRAKVYLCEPNQPSREGTAADVVRQTGGMLIPPYNHPDVIAGQGTLALEMLEDHPDLDAIIAPIGGGGLMSGVCIAASSPLPLGEGSGVRAAGAAGTRMAPEDSRTPSPQPSPKGRGNPPRVRLFAAEPIGADDAARSMQTGQLQPQGRVNTIADGLLTGMGDLTWPIVRDHVERVITVSDDQIIAAMRLVWERMKIVVEPSGAVSVAVALSDEFKSLGGLKKVGVVLSGGNVDLDRLPWMK
jgi:threonine dehydratase